MRIIAFLLTLSPLTGFSGNASIFNCSISGQQVDPFRMVVCVWLKFR